VTIGGYQVTALPTGWDLEMTEAAPSSDPSQDPAFAIRGRLVNQSDDITLTIMFSNNMDLFYGTHTKEAAEESIFTVFRGQDIDMTAERFMQAYPDPYALRKALAGLKAQDSLPREIDRSDTERQKVALLTQKTSMYGGVIPIEIKAQGFRAFYATHTRDDEGYTVVNVDICSPGEEEVMRLEVNDRRNAGGPERMAVRRMGVALIMALERGEQGQKEESSP
jgi:hypothetical protein